MLIVPLLKELRSPNGSSIQRNWRRVQGDASPQVLVTSPPSGHLINTYISTSEGATINKSGILQNRQTSKIQTNTFLLILSHYNVNYAIQSALVRVGNTEIAKRLKKRKCDKCSNNSEKCEMCPSTILELKRYIRRFLIISENANDTVSLHNLLITNNFTGVHVLSKFVDRSLS